MMLAPKITIKIDMIILFFIICAAFKPSLKLVAAGALHVKNDHNEYPEIKPISLLYEYVLPAIK